MPLTIRYHLFNSLRFCPDSVNWCTDYDPKDYGLMVKRELSGRSPISPTAPYSSMIFSIPPRGEKQKLVNLYPDTLSWVSTHLTGPNQYSQFIYIISPNGNDASSLDFTGLHIDYSSTTANPVDVAILTNRLCTEDANAWKRLAKAMAENCGNSR